MKLKMFDSTTQAAWTLLLAHVFIAILLGYQLWSYERLATYNQVTKTDQSKSWGLVGKIPNASNAITRIDDIEKRSEKWKQLSSMLGVNWKIAETELQLHTEVYEVFVNTNRKLSLIGLVFVLVTSLTPIWIWHRHRKESNGSINRAVASPPPVP